MHTLDTTLAPSYSEPHSATNAREGAAAAKRRLAVIDLDGTLLSSYRRISPENLRALDLLREDGFEIVIASGRHHRNILRFEPEIGPLNWVISTSGAVVQNAVTGELLHELTIPEAEALAVQKAARQGGVAVIAYHRDGIFMEAECPASQAYASRAGWRPEPANLEQLAATGFQKLLVSEAPEILTEVGTKLEKAFADRLYVVWTERDIVEFLSPQANKAVGVEALARKLGLAQSEVFSFGDGNNDVEMLAWAGFSIAMAHGETRALQAAKAVTPPGPPETAFARGVELVLSER
jgi:Cof subfamily protein (haloacid dehalogenase superfamily)